jgi:hypothetical protein
MSKFRRIKGLRKDKGLKSAYLLIIVIHLLKTTSVFGLFFNFSSFFGLSGVHFSSKIEAPKELLRTHFAPSRPLPFHNL